MYTYAYIDHGFGWWNRHHAFCSASQYACMPICMYVCVYIYIYIYIYNVVSRIDVYIYTHTHINRSWFWLVESA